MSSHVLPPWLSDGSLWEGNKSTAVAVGGALVLVSALWLWWNRFTPKGKPLPCPPNEHWLLGSIPQMGTYMARYGEHLDASLAAFMRDFPSLGKLWVAHFGPVDMVCAIDPDAVREIVLTSNYNKSPTYSALVPFVGAKSMVLTHGSSWRRARTAFNQAFTFQFLRSLVPVFVDKTVLLANRLDKASRTGEVLLLHEWATRLTMDVILQVVLSGDWKLLGSDTPPDIYTTFMALLRTTADNAQKVHLAWMRYLPWNAARWYSLQRRFDAHLTKVIRQRMNEQQAAKAEGRAVGPPTDILGMALATPPEEGSSTLDMMEVLSQVKTFLFAGHDTTATALAFAVYEISLNPRVEAAVLEEVDRVCPDAPPSADQLNSLKYLTAVVKESLRLWPPGGTARMAPKGSTYKGYDIGGKVLYVPHMPLHRDPDLWGPDVLEFRPERWLDEAYVAKLHPMAYQPFSKGPRDCIGQTFAMMEAKTVMATLYRSFTFEYAGNGPESQGYKITSFPKQRVPVKVIQRTK